MRKTTNSKDGNQMSFNLGPIQARIFSIRNLTEAKIRFLETKMESLTFGEMSWLATIEDFFRKKNYITEKQVSVLDAIVTSVKQRTSSYQM